MELLIVRHAIAVERGDPAFELDEDRPLTPEGIHKFRLAARGLKEVAPKLDRIVSSPLVRARQTAEILREVIAPHRKLEFCEHLVPSGDLDALVLYLGRLGSESVALVGHEPHLSSFTSYLLAGKNGAAFVEYKKGGAGLMTFPHEPAAGSGTLEWLIQPGALRDIGAA
jgi:phosphohistidine phosphatase